MQMYKIVLGKAKKKGAQQAGGFPQAAMAKLFAFHRPPQMSSTTDHLSPSVDHQHRQKQKGLSSVVMQPIMTRTPLLPMSFLWPISAFCLAQVSNSFAPR